MSFEFLREESKTCPLDSRSVRSDGHCLSSEIPGCFVVVELDVLGTAEVGHDLHDVILLLGRELVFAVMNTIVGAHAGTKV